ncbi:MAG: lipoprotein [Pseudomonadota bacterium]
MKTLIASCCLICCTAFVLSACGNKGSLVLPAKPGDHSSPAAAESKPAPR